ncbi:MAG: DNA repair protein RecN [Oligoflexia bacterium]|nr:DNA repair protein RecN [Oligoflexia bacterium]
MLTCLSVRSFAIIDRVEVTLGPGLTVFTGETGAGKSILVSALHLVLGARARPDLVRAGADQAEVEALFSVDAQHLDGRLAGMGLESGDELLIRRTVQAPGCDQPGRSRAYVNGRLATATQLATLATGLVDICSQHEHHTLVDPATHLGHLDAFGDLVADRLLVSDAYAAASAAARDLASAREALRDRGDRQDLLRFQLGEVERLDPDEDETLRAEVQRLSHVERLSQAAGGGEHLLYSGDGAVCSTLDRVSQDLRQASRYDPALAELADRLDIARTDLEEAARDLRSYARSLDADPARLQQAEDRLHVLRGLTRRFGGTVQSVLDHAVAARAELATLDQVEQRVDQCEHALAVALSKARDTAGRLSARRQQHAAALGHAFSEQLAGLGMGDARVLVDVAPVGDARPGDLDLDGARLTASGVDRVEFLIAPNPGEPPKPLRRVASGGELSRALLALKCVIGGVDPDGLYVFDEVDAGVGGAVAEVIGQKLRAISRDHQVLCITHLPQIAAYADRHYRVEKTVRQGRTHSRILGLDDAQRREELARMLGGIQVTDASRQAADALLEAAR